MNRQPSVARGRLCRAIEDFFVERQALLLPSGEQTKDGTTFSWCGDVFEFLTEGLAERLGEKGITFTKSFPGPFSLMDEEQHPDGNHVRRFWTTALEHGCPVARICTYFFHRHDQIRLPRLPQIVSFPPDQDEPEQTP